MQYLRLGNIPKFERSINFIKLTPSMREDMWLCECPWDEIDRLANLERIADLKPVWSNVDKNEIFEAGVSVFEIDENGEPVLNDDQIRQSYHYRKNTCKAYIVTGDVVGRGADGEPLLKNIKIVKEV